MSFQMMYADDGDVECEAQTCRDTRNNQQRACQPRPLRISDPVDVAWRTPGLAEQLSGQREYSSHVIPGGQFRYHAAVLRMHGHLRKKGVAKQAGLGVVQCDAGFVTGRLDA